MDVTELINLLHRIIERITWGGGNPVYISLCSLEEGEDTGVVDR